MTAGGIVLSVVILGGLIWMITRSRNPSVPPDLLNPDVDFAELRDAEAELEDLDPLTTPDEADDRLPDWGPGAPKH